MLLICIVIYNHVCEDFNECFSFFLLSNRSQTHRNVSGDSRSPRNNMPFDKPPKSARDNVPHGVSSKSREAVGQARELSRRHSEKNMLDRNFYDEKMKRAEDSNHLPKSDSHNYLRSNDDLLSSNNLSLNHRDRFGDNIYDHPKRNYDIPTYAFGDNPRDRLPLRQDLPPPPTQYCTETQSRNFNSSIPDNEEFNFCSDSKRKSHDPARPSRPDKTRRTENVSVAQLIDHTSDASIRGAHKPMSVNKVPKVLPHLQSSLSNTVSEKPVVSRKNKPILKNHQENNRTSNSNSYSNKNTSLNDPKNSSEFKQMYKKHPDNSGNRGDPLDCSDVCRPQENIPNDMFDDASLNERLIQSFNDLELADAKDKTDGKSFANQRCDAWDFVTSKLDSQGYSKDVGNRGDVFICVWFNKDRKSL